jgi:RHS repeat-associated protein
VDSASNTHWMHQDAQGSTKLITGAYGAAENAYKYYPFGDSLNFTGTVKNDVKYTGQSYVEGIEAYDYNARYYDPELGRFYSRDPMGSAATSPYAYCGNDPVNFIDPSGMVALPAPTGMEDGGFNGQAVCIREWFGRWDGKDIYVTGWHGVGDMDFANYAGTRGSWLESTGLIDQVRWNDLISANMYAAKNTKTVETKPLTTNVNDITTTQSWFNVISFTFEEYQFSFPDFMITSDPDILKDPSIVTDPNIILDKINTYKYSKDPQKRNEARSWLDYKRRWNVDYFKGKNRHEKKKYHPVYF